MKMYVNLVNSIFYCDTPMFEADNRKGFFSKYGKMLHNLQELGYKMGQVER